MSDRVDQDDVIAELEAVEMQEWLDSLDYVLQYRGPERVKRLLQQLQVYAQQADVDLPFSANTPYINTIPVDRQPLFPGSRETRSTGRLILGSCLRTAAPALR